MMPTREKATTMDQSPMQPDHWADRDRRVGTQILLPVQQAVTLQGEPPCDCRGTWRYVLLPHVHRPLWRCLHCGDLHRGDQTIPEVPDSPTA